MKNVDPCTTINNKITGDLLYFSRIWRGSAYCFMPHGQLKSARVSLLVLEVRIYFSSCERNKRSNSFCCIAPQELFCIIEETCGVFVVQGLALPQCIGV